MYIVEQLNDGPMANIFHNVELTSNIIICHLELEAEMVNQRVGLTTGPLEALFEKHFGEFYHSMLLLVIMFLGESTSFGRKTIKMLKALVEPFRDELQFSNDEDDVLAAAIDGSEAFAERESLVINGDSGVNQTDASAESNTTLQPIWTKLKTELGRNAARRAQQRCEQTIATSIQRCHETFAETQVSILNSRVS